jgi:uncharacterized membrane-anchored protein
MSKKASLKERLEREAHAIREAAKTMRPGEERDNMIKKARQIETAIHMEDWLKSPGLQPPK